jgi:hypothetical protein
MSQPGKLKDRLDEILFSMLGSQELVTRWWATPNKAFDMQPPEAADLMIVKDYIIWHAFCAGG